MIIPKNAADLAPLASSPPAYFRQNRQVDSGEQAGPSDRVSLSQAARDLLSSDSTNHYQVQGTVYSLADVLKKNPGIRPFAEISVEEYELWEAQKNARDDAINRYAQEHLEKIYGQVVVNGELYATVWDGGSAQLPVPTPDLTNDGDPLQVAKARLQEIAQAVHGEIRYSNFLPLPDGMSESSGAVIPDSFLATLPPITARPFPHFRE